MLDEKRAEHIISIFKSMDVTTRLELLNEAKGMLSHTFKDTISDLDYAKNVMRVEQFYNLIREELRVPQKRIKADMGEDSVAVKSKPKTKKAPKPNPAMDMAEMMNAFAKFKGGTNAG